MKDMNSKLTLGVILLCFCSCGSSHGPDTPIFADTSSSASVNPVSKNGNIIVGATLLGGLVGAGVVPLNKSAPIEVGNESIQVALAKIVFQDVIKRSINEFGQTQLSKSIDELKNDHKKIEYVKEPFSVYGGYVTITGSLDYDIDTTARKVNIDGIVTFDFMNVSFPVVYGGESKVETINGTIRTDMTEDVLYELDGQGNLTKTYAKLNSLYTSDWLQITGDVPGNAKHINIIYKAAADLVSGKAISGPECGGEVTVLTDKLVEVCDIRSACDGCSESSTVENL